MREKMEQGWYLLPSEKIIARERIPFLSAFLTFFGFKRTKMVELYSMTKRAFHSPTTISKMMAYPFPLEHDNFPKPDRYPFYYRLNNGWSIEAGNQKFLKDGPLFSENSREVIVHSKVFVQSLLQQIWKIISVFGILLGIVTGLISLFG